MAKEADSLCFVASAMECGRDVSPSYVIDADEGSTWGDSAPADAQWASGIPIATFEYILMAPTSAAVPVHEEPVTFLNQHHSYEVKCRKSEPKTKSRTQFKTVITLCFESRKLRYQMNELLAAWKNRNLGKRFLVIDRAMCNNISSVKHGTRSAEFVWDGDDQNTCVYLKFFVACSDFTENAGEKGQPFRLVIQTFEEGSSQLIQQSSSQIQIFKLRGAERKRQTEREKANKLGNQEQFQPAYDYTILLNTPFEYGVEDEPRVDSDEADAECRKDRPSSVRQSQSPSCTATAMATTIMLDATLAAVRSPSISPAVLCSSRKRSRMSTTDDGRSSRETSVDNRKLRLRASFSPTETAEWLRLHRFHKCANLFAEYDGEDMLRVTLTELSSLMGSEAEAIRLFHAMRKKIIEPLCVLYLAVEESDVYTMMMIHEGSVSELRERIQEISERRVDSLFVSGPKGIRVSLTEEVIQSWPTDSIFRIVFRDGKCILVPER